MNSAKSGGRSIFRALFGAFNIDVLKPGMSKNHRIILEAELARALDPMYYSALKTMAQYDFGVVATSEDSENINILGVLYQGGFRFRNSDPDFPFFRL